MNKKTTTRSACAVILAAGRGTRISKSNGFLKPLLEVNGIPAIVSIIRSLMNQNISQFRIVVNKLNHRQVKEVLYNAFSGMDLQLLFFVQEEQFGPAHALSTGINKNTDEKNVLVCLVDTLFNEELNLNKDWVGVSKTSLVGRWCWADSKDNVLKKLYDKVQPPKGTNAVLVGLYNFKDGRHLRHCVDIVLKKRAKRAESEFQLSSVIDEYCKRFKVFTNDIESWVDIGSIENYKKAQNQFLRHRHFNSFRVCKRGNTKTVVKSSNFDKISDEIHWFKLISHISPEIIPRIYKFSRSSFEMEHYQWRPISEAYLYQTRDGFSPSKTIRSLLKFTNEKLWSKENHEIIDLNKESKEMYFIKPYQRLDKWPLWKTIRETDEITINNTIFKNVDELFNRILKFLESNHNPKLATIHGDFHFGNILHDKDSNSFVLVDPRGKFGNHRGTIGDLYYDLGKLRHSYQGLYDAILDGLFSLSVSKNKYQFSMGPERKHEIMEIDKLIESMGYNIDLVKMIELSILLSLIPLHSDSSKNQLAFFLQAVLLTKEIKL